MKGAESSLPVGSNECKLVQHSSMFSISVSISISISTIPGFTTARYCADGSSHVARDEGA